MERQNLQKPLEGKGTKVYSEFGGRFKCVRFGICLDEAVTVNVKEGGV